MVRPALVFPNPVALSDAGYLYYLSRSWSPGLTGIRGRLSRFTARGREAIDEYLASPTRTLES